jgi:hypothetical protein
VNKWINFLENNSTLVELGLSENYIKKHFFRKIFHSLATFSSSKIRKVDFSYNQISDHDILMASPGLEGNPSLEYLDFSHNLIESKGALALIFYSSLKDCRLQEVNLFGNNQICETVFYYSIQAMKKVSNYCELMKDEIMNEMIKLGESEVNVGAQEKISSLRQSCLFLLQPDKTISSSSALMVHVSQQVNRPKKQEIVVEEVKKGSKKPDKTKQTAVADIHSEDNSKPSRRPMSFAFDPLNLHGNYELSLDDPYQHLIAKMIIESIHYHPFSSFREIKWFNPRMKVYEYFSFYRKNTSVSLPTSLKTTNKESTQKKKLYDPLSYEEEDDVEAVEEEKRKDVELRKGIQSTLLPYFNKNQNLFILLEKLISKMISVNRNETIDNYLAIEKTKKFRMSFEKEGYIGENEKKVLEKTEKERKEKLLLEMKSLLLIVMNEKFQFHLSLEMIEYILITWNKYNVSETEMNQFLSNPFSFLAKMLSVLFDYCFKEIKKKLDGYDGMVDEERSRSIVSNITVSEFRSFFICFFSQRSDCLEKKATKNSLINEVDDDLLKYFSEVVIDHPFFLKASFKRIQQSEDYHNDESTSLFNSCYSINSIQFLQQHLLSILHRCLTLINLQNNELSLLNDFYNPYLVLGLNQPYSVPFEGKLSFSVNIPFSSISMIPYNQFLKNSFHFFVESFLSSSLSSSSSSFSMDHLAINKYKHFNDFIFGILENYENYLFLSYSQAEEILKILLIIQTNIKYYSVMTLIEKLMFQMYSFHDFKQFLIRNLYFNQVRLYFLCFVSLLFF